ncbi:hypothetical protein CWM47_30440 [Spirosoma pollinicola]|uniref:Integrase catalytic domain-containing protein n=1 Tax=Spirosoma pollinicola TaxID=2057025 RepID=A0A2K8Z7D5_9BACT|nr:hypothetical protein CWM47_30440 [Spirosoma pollinicola]
MKNELVYQQNFTTVEMTKQALFEYIEVWYNGIGHPASTEAFGAWLPFTPVNTVKGKFNMLLKFLSSIL